MTRGYMAIGIYGCKTEANIGTLMRSAYLYDAAFVFAVGRRYARQASDTPNTMLHKPLFEFATIDDLVEHLPRGCPLIGVELDPRAIDLTEYQHPERAAYLLGAEDNGLPVSVMDSCHDLITIPYPGGQSMNVSAAGSIVLYDRYAKATTRKKALV